jgi:hypothetical protein
MTARQTDADQAAPIRAAAERLAAAGESRARPGRDPVNLPMIRNWIEAIGDPSPVWTDQGAAVAAGHSGAVAPPAMIQVWTMPGLHRVRPDDDPLGQMSQVLDEAGFTSVVATNCDQVYHRYLRHGEQVSVRAGLLDVTGPKRTALGEGWFVTTRSTWYAGDEPVATMDFRILKFRPRPAQAQAAPPVAVLRPPASPDTAFFWAGTAAGELRIQECGQCGARRHPPGPMCPQCGAAQRPAGGEPGYVVAAGTGTVYSYVVHHHPPVPGKTLPLVIALAELPEGVRVLAGMPGTDPAGVEVGMPVRIGFERIDDELTLPVWHPAGEVGRASEGAAGAVFPTSDAARRRSAKERGGKAAPQSGPARASKHSLPAALREPASTAALPELVIEATPTFVISSALATRDFQDVHHDRDLAVARGSTDIFVNILTSTGLVQRFVSGWAGPGAVIRSIAIRLGAPCYAGDTLTFSGRAGPAADGERTVTVTGRCSAGDHVTGTVLVWLPGSAA